MEGEYGEGESKKSILQLEQLRTSKIFLKGSILILKRAIHDKDYNSNAIQKLDKGLDNLNNVLKPLQSSSHY
jgi:hypothetical protein